MSIQDDVLSLFREEIPGYLDCHWKEIPLTLDSDLFDTPGDDFEDAITRYQAVYNVDLSIVDWSCYFPWQNTPLRVRWFRARRKDVEKTRLPLTVRMFAESAEAGEWLFARKSPQE